MENKPGSEMVAVDGREPSEREKLRLWADARYDLVYTHRESELVESYEAIVAVAKAALDRGDRGSLEALHSLACAL